MRAPSGEGQGDGVARRAQRGFSLLEMMIAISLLAVSLLSIINATTNAIAAENHAKLMTTATFLARQRLVEIEDRYLDKGPTDSEIEGERAGDFEDEGFKRFRWESKVVKSAHLGEIMETLNAFSAAADPKASGSGSSSSKGGAPGAGGVPGVPGMGQLGALKEVLDQTISDCTVRVLWMENGVPQNVEVTTVFTYLRGVDQAIQIPGLPGGVGGQGIPGIGGSTGGGGTGGTGGFGTGGFGTGGGFGSGGATSGSGAMGR